MDDLIQIAVMLLFFYILYRVGSFLWTLTKAAFLWLWMMMGLTTGARFRRIVRRADKEQEAVSKVYIREMQRISDTTSNDILRRK